MKIKAKIAYKDNTHKHMMYLYNVWMDTYKQFIEEGDSRMVDYMYKQLWAATDLLFFADCINHERKKYLEHEVDKMRGWA